MSTLRIHDFDFAYQRLSPPSPSATPLVLIHGFPLDGRVWAHVAAITARRHDTIVPDLRGFGDSGRGAFAIDSLADDLHELLKRLDVLPAVLAGLSMGGYVALAFARRFPADVAGLALVDTRANADDEAGRRTRDEMINLVRLGGVEAVVDQMLPNLLASPNPEVRQRLREIMLSVPAATIEQAALAMKERPDQRDLLGQLNMSVSVIVGEEDAITPSPVAQEMVTAIPGAELVVIPAAGHLTPLERPDAVAPALERLMDRVDGR